MTNHKYLLKITPLGTFFFGGEKTFTSASGETNYFARSNFWPQQTTILGSLRYIVGKEKGFHTDKIGKHSFIANYNNGFGIISKLSPVFLLSEHKDSISKKWIEAGSDYQFKKNSDELLRVYSNQMDGAQVVESDFFKIYATGIAGKQQIPNLKFDYKEYLISALYDSESKQNLINPMDKCVEQFQVGNMKSYSGGADDDAFFKQVFYKLHENFSFGVYVETTEELSFTNKKEIVAMGADQSLFCMSFDKLKDDEEYIFEKIDKNNKKITGKGRVVLLSDAYVKPEILEKCSFAIADTVDFRNIITYEVDDGDNKKTELHYNIDTNSQNPGAARKSSVKYNLLKRGSVLFDTDLSAIEDLLKNDSFNKIGYNHFEVTN